jgi:hypothetical protein
VPQVRHGFGRGGLTQDDLGDIAGQHFRAREDGDGHCDDQHHTECEALPNEPQ